MRVCVYFFNIYTHRYMFVQSRFPPLLDLDTQSAQQLVPGSQSPQLLASGHFGPDATALLQVLVHVVSLSAGWHYPGSPMSDETGMVS